VHVVLIIIVILFQDYQIEKKPNKTPILNYVLLWLPSWISTLNSYTFLLSHALILQSTPSFPLILLNINHIHVTVINENILRYPDNKNHHIPDSFDKSRDKIFSLITHKISNYLMLTMYLHSSMYKLHLTW
jgi:hypothetical protein